MGSIWSLVPAAPALGSARLLQATASHTLRARPSQYYGVMRLAVAMQLTRLMATRMGLKPFTISDLSTCSILVG